MPVVGGSACPVLNIWDMYSEPETGTRQKEKRDSESIVKIWSRGKPGRQRPGYTRFEIAAVPLSSCLTAVAGRRCQKPLQGRKRHFPSQISFLSHPPENLRSPDWTRTILSWNPRPHSISFCGASPISFLITARPQVSQIYAAPQNASPGHAPTPGRNRFFGSPSRHTTPFRETPKKPVERKGHHTIPPRRACVFRPRRVAA